MKSHHWEEKETATERGNPGKRQQCSGCGHRIFMPDGFSAFQQRLMRTVSFIDCCKGLDEETVAQLSSEFGATEAKGIHAVLANRCDLVKSWNDTVAVHVVMST